LPRSAARRLRVAFSRSRIVPSRSLSRRSLRSRLVSLERSATPRTARCPLSRGQNTVGQRRVRIGMGISIRRLAIRRHLTFNHLRPTVSLRSLAVRVSDTERPPSSPGVIFGYAALSDTVGRTYFIGRHRKRLDEGRTNQGNDSSISVRQYEETTPGRIEKATDSGDSDEVARGTSGLSASRSVEDVPGSRKSDFRGQGPQGAPRLRTTASPGIRADRGFRAVAVAVVASISMPCLESLSSEHNRRPGETANVMDRGNRSCRREYHKRLTSARLCKNRQPFRGSELIIHDRACC